MHNNFSTHSNGGRHSFEDLCNMLHCRQKQSCFDNSSFVEGIVFVVAIGEIYTITCVILTYRYNPVMSEGHENQQPKHEVHCL